MAINNSAQKFIARNRAPRVQIEYDVEGAGYGAFLGFINLSNT
ncbi:hypothetical protein GCM10029978_119950 [Actinoallomurus acanthiterrae]